MPALCRDILQNIFHRLPAKDLIELKPVCKLWKRIIEDPLFVKSHTKNHQSAAASILIQHGNGGNLFSIPIDRLRFADDVYDINICTIPLKQLNPRGLPLLTDLPAPSCNGLILISHENMNKSWAIWNLLTQDFHVVPPPPPYVNESASLISCISCGFGYDETSDDYKVVRVDGNRELCLHYRRCMIYSLKSRRWKEMKSSFTGRDYRGVGVFLNGALHWKLWRGDEIFVLHLGREDHHLVAGPPRPPQPKADLGCNGLDALDGCLILSYNKDAWVMKDYENKVWTKLFTLDAFTLKNMRVVGYLKSKGQVFLQHGENALTWLDLESKCAKEITISGVAVRDRHSFGQLFPGSLVRLDGTTKSIRAGAKRKRKSEKRVKRDEAYAVNWKSEDDEAYTVKVWTVTVFRNNVTSNTVISI